MMAGRTTPASQGSKYVSSSWSPEKYQGAFAGLGVSAGSACSSSGALNTSEKAKSSARHSIAASTSRPTRCGKVST